MPPTQRRVLSPWLDQWLYPATVLYEDEDIAYVDYDDGDRNFVPSGELQPLEIKRGQHLQVSRNRRSKFYAPGTVLDSFDEDLLIRYSDNTEEWLTVAFVRLQSPNTGSRAWHEFAKPYERWRQELAQLKGR
jgi:hypothetical protein